MTTIQNTRRKIIIILHPCQVLSLSDQYFPTKYLRMVAEPTNADEGTLYEILNVPTSASSKEVCSQAPIS